MRRARTLVALGSFALAAALPAAEPLNRVVLRVNSEIVTLADYEGRKQSRLASISEAEGLSTEERRRFAAEAGRATMRELFDELLVLSRAHQLRLGPTTAQIDAAVESTRERMGLDDPAQFEAALAQSGLTLAAFRGRMEQNLAFNETLQREVQSKVKVEDDVLLRLYRDQADRYRSAERRRVEELVVREDSGQGAAERRELAAELARAVGGGESMAAAVERLGGGAVAGPIDLGWVVAGELADVIDAEVWRLGAGQVSAPVEGRGGLHVLRVAEVEVAKVRPFDEVKEQIRAEEGQRRYEKAARDFLAELERTAYVVENIPEEAVGYRSALPEDPEATGVLGEFSPRRSETGSAPASAEPPSASPPPTPTPPPLPL